MNTRLIVRENTDELIIRMFGLTAPNDDLQKHKVRYSTTIDFTCCRITFDAVLFFSTYNI